MTRARIDIDVHDDRATSRFLVSERGSTAELTYRTGRGRLTLVHTGVPPVLAGRGIGVALVRAALDRARTDRLMVVPWCPFARRWLREHPEAWEGVKIDWTPLP